MPKIGEAGQVILHDVPLMLVPGTYQCVEAERFGEKISTGDLRYADFTPGETGFPTGSWHGGYGLRRYSDWNSSPESMTMYLEADGVECSEAGVAYLSPLQIAENLPFDVTDTEGPPVWIGEMAVGGTDTLICVAGNALFSRSTTAHPSVGTWTRQSQLAGVALRGAVGTFNGRLIVGYGSAAIAQYTTNLTVLSNVANATPANLYVWAFTSDRSAAYIAGGTTTADFDQVTSSTDGGTGYSASPTACGDPSSEITSLSPGGGMAILFIGKEDELGCIDTSGNYRVLMPFYSSKSTNARGMRWWLGTGGDEQRGPAVIFFPRDRGIWSYQPSTDTAGSASNLTPWTLPGVRPLNARGTVQAIHGSDQWLYYSLSSGHIVRRSARGGVTHNYLTVADGCLAIHITTLFGTNPCLFYGDGNDISYVVLPLEGESALDDSATRYCSTGDLYLPDADLNFPDENKTLYSEGMSFESLSGSESIAVAMNEDGSSTYTTVGTATSSTFLEAAYAAETFCKRWGRKLTFTTTDSTKTPKLRAIVSRVSLTTRLLREWSFEAYLPGGTLNNLTDDVADPYVSARTFWNDRSSGVPTTFTDRWGDEWSVKVKKVGEREIEVQEEDGKHIEQRIGLTLLEAKRIGTSMQWGAFTWGSPYSVWG